MFQSSLLVEATQHRALVGIIACALCCATPGGPDVEGPTQQQVRGASAETFVSQCAIGASPARQRGSQLRRAVTPQELGTTVPKTVDSSLKPLDGVNNKLDVAVQQACDECSV